MDLDDVRIFTKVVDAGSFTKAAQLLAMPKSTVSRRVSELEEHLGVRLLQRTTRKLHLTDAGELFFERTARIMEEMVEAERAILDLQSEPQGLLRITTPGDLSGTMPEMLGEFQRHYPAVQVVVFGTGRRVDLIAEGYDLALRAGSLADSSLVHRLIYKVVLGVFASPGYLEAHGSVSHPEDLSRHQCLIFSHEKTTATWKLIGPSGAVDVPVSGKLATRDFHLIRGSAVLGQGIAYMPTLACMDLVRQGRLVRLLPEFHSEESNLYAVYPSPRHLSPKVRAFIDFTVEWWRSHVLVV